MVVESLEVLLQDGTPTGQRVALINGDGLQLAQPRTITVATAPGRIGQIAYDTNNLYICIAPNSWKKVAMTTI